MPNAARKAGHGPCFALAGARGAPAAIAVAALFVAGVMAQTRPAVDVPPPQNIPPAEFRPISYFNDKCGSCHGNYGSFWGGGFARNLGGDELREVVRAMAEGPAQAPLEDPALDALVAWHRSLADGSPFVIITRRDGTTLAGEVTPGSRVAIRSGDRTIPAEVEGHRWQVTVGEGGGDGALAVIATKDGKTTRLPPDTWHSHASAKPE